MKGILNAKLAWASALLLLVLALPSGARADGKGLMQIVSADQRQGEAVYSVINTSDGGYATIGASNDGEQLCVRKYDEDGSLRFASECEGTPMVRYRLFSSYHLAETPGGGFVFNADALLSEGCSNMYDSSIVMLDAQGNQLWKARIGEVYGVDGVVALDDGGVMVAANYMLYKLGADGQKLWEKKPFDATDGDNSRASISAMCLMEDGSVVAAGHHSYPGSFTETVYNCVTRLDADGNTLWINRGDGMYYTLQIPYATATSDGGFILSGWEGSFAYMAKYNGAGAAEWLYQPDKPTIFNHYKSIVETDEGYMAMGHADGGDINGDTYYNTMLMRIGKGGNIIEQATIGSGMDWPAGIVSRGADSFIIEGYSNGANGQCNGLMLKLAINRDPAYQPQNGWKKEGNGASGWRYYTNGHMQRGWVNSVGKWYLMDYDGSMVTGWVNAGGFWYHMKPDGSMTTGWLKDNSAGSTRWYYLGSRGKMTTFPSRIGGLLYHFNKDGSLHTGGWVEDQDNWHYIFKDGQAATGWHRIGGKWHSFDPEHGYWNRGYENERGWFKAKGGWAFTGVHSGYVTGWQLIGGKWYYFGNSGIMRTGWQQIEGKWYHMKPDGSMTTGWLEETVSGSGPSQSGSGPSRWYYLKGSGEMVTGEYSLNGVKHVFNSSGVWQGKK